MPWARRLNAFSKADSRVLYLGDPINAVKLFNDLHGHPVRIERCHFEQHLALLDGVGLGGDRARAGDVAHRAEAHDLRRKPAC